MRTRRSPKNQDRFWRQLGKEKAPVIPCEWKEDSDGNWHTACGELFILMEGTPVENEMKFCPFCGRPLKQVIFVEEIIGEEDD